MIRKFATIPGLSLFQFAILVIILTGVAAVHAQQTPAQQPPQQPQTQQQPQPQQQPQTQQQPGQSSSQETSEVDIGPSRRHKPPNYKKWSFNAGGGASLLHGTTHTYVRGGGGVAAAGVARNYNKYFGLRLDVQFDNLPLRTSALELAQAPGANSHVYSAMLDPIINIPVTKNWGGYFVVGPSFYHRSGKLDSSSAIPGSACNGFFEWWGRCNAGSLPIDGNFLHSSLNQLGENFGGGLTRKIHPNIDFYAEFRYMHGKHGDNSTDLSPITVGIRW